MVRIIDNFARRLYNMNIKEQVKRAKNPDEKCKCLGDATCGGVQLGRRLPGWDEKHEGS